MGRHRNHTVTSLSANPWLSVKAAKDPDFAAILFAYRLLPKEQQAIIDGLITLLSDEIRGLGQPSALELLFNLGRFLNKNGEK